MNIYSHPSYFDVNKKGLQVTLTPISYHILISPSDESSRDRQELEQCGPAASYDPFEPVKFEARLAGDWTMVGTWGTGFGKCGNLMP